MSLVVPSIACSLIFCCLSTILPRRRVCVKVQSLYTRGFAILLLRMRAVLFLSCVYLPFVVRFAAVEGRALARAVAMSVAVSWRIDSTGVADGDANEVDSPPISSEGAKEGVVFLGLLGELVLEAEIPAEADLEEDEGAVLAVEGVEVRSGVGWHSSGVDDVGSGFHSCRHQVVEVILWEDPNRYVSGGHHAFFVVSRCISLHGESLCVYGHINSAISVERGGRSCWGYPLRIARLE